MNRLEYLTRLRQCLVDGCLSKEELEDALSFYEEIFLDAGVGFEEQTAQNLGEPEDLARKILLDSGVHADGEAVFQMDEAKKPGEEANEYQNQSANYSNGSSVLVKLLIVAITFPIWVPIVCAVGGIAFGLVIAVISIIAAFILAGIGCIIGGVAALFAVPPVGLMLLGGGIILLSMSSLVLAPVMKALWRAVVRFFNWIIAGIRRLFRVGGDKVNG